MSQNKQVFFLLVLSQFLSLLGTDVVKFAVRVWTYKETGSVAQFAFITFFTEIPSLLLSPLAGAIVDRYPRKLILLLSDSISMCASLMLVVSYSHGSLGVWKIYAAGFVQSLMNGLQWPAFTATVSLLVDKEELVRFNSVSQGAIHLSMMVSLVC